MSKRDLKKYLQTLKKKELEAQVLDLYTRFKDVKVYYDFVFNPKEDKLIDEAKTKIAFVPFEGGGAIMTSLVGNQIEAAGPSFQ